MPTLLGVNNYYYRRGGAETIFLEQNRLLEEFGWSVVPFCMHHPENYSTPWARYFVDEIEYGKTYTLQQKLSMVPKTMFSLEARRKLRSLLRETKPDVCHAHNIYHHISPSILGLLSECGIPTVLTLHDLKLACPAYTMLTHDGVCERCKKNKLYNVVLHRCIKGSRALSAIVFVESALHRLLKTYDSNVARFVVPSHFYIKKLVEWGFDADRLTHIPNFVETNHVQPSSSVGEAFLYAGRLAPEKGVVTLMKAAAQAGVPLWLAGSGPQESALRQLASQSRSEIIFFGYLSKEALYAKVREARAVVLPSEWYENAPLTIMESYASGTPVIGARIGGIPELIREGETGLSFVSGSVEDLARALRQVADMPSAAVRELGQEGRRWMQVHYSPQIYRERLLSLYQTLGVSAGVSG